MDFSAPYWILVSAAFVTSTLSGTIGMGGGILLMAIMADFLAPLTLIPVHGIVQMASNLSRTAILFTHIQWKIALWFGLGAIVGAGLGSQVVVVLPERWFRLGIGCFILLVTFTPKLKNTPEFKGKWLSLGGAAGFLGLFVGATGPLIAPFFLREGLKKEALVATKACCQCFVHAFKIAAYFSLGFVIGPYLGLLGGMIVAVFLGNLLGRYFLHKLPERLFARIFQVLIVVLAGRLILRALLGG